VQDLQARYIEHIMRGYMADPDRIEGHHARAHAGHQLALEMAQELGDRRYLAVHTSHLAHVKFLQGDVAAAREAFSQAETALRQIQDTLELAMLLSWRGLLDASEGRRDAAQAALEEASALAKACHASAGSRVSNAVEMLREVLY